MKYELWYSASECSAVLLHESDRGSRQLKPADAIVIWEVEAETYDEALQGRDEFFKSWESSGQGTVDRDTSTTRFTMAMYVDEDGQERSLAAPGWVGMFPKLIEADINASMLLGQMYFERPGGCAPLDTGEFLSEVRAAGIKEITVVDLRSADGMKRMCQEFYGRIEGIERISNMLQGRLGPEMSNWTVVVAHVLGHPADGER